MNSYISKKEYMDKIKADLTEVEAALKNPFVKAAVIKLTQQWIDINADISHLKDDPIAYDDYFEMVMYERCACFINLKGYN